MWTLAGILTMVVAAHQVASSSKNCIALTKSEQGLLRMHSHACLSQSGASEDSVNRLLRGEPLDEPSLRRHVYCVMHSWKIIGKDGKMNKLAYRGSNNAQRTFTKELEDCAKQTGDSPEDMAWNLFKCGFDKKVKFLEY